MSIAKETILENMNRISETLGELEIVERLYMLSRLEHSKRRCCEEGTVSQKNGKRKHPYELEWSPDAIVDLDTAGIAADQLRQQAKALRKNPEKGTVIPEIGDEHFRELGYKICNIVYEIKETSILVHAIYEKPLVFNRAINKLAYSELLDT